ncbi:putative membrane protein [Yersinia rochesterensis]|uniref:Membrane protein n=1 Tax=Yersinia rochesterensis TaxID=1604335 RepID=A0ABN4FF76_9GAMM|nr:putative membrane protein [Yersinia rochesterensis]AJI87160.1 putative membrane protein [Yersinia frederiksenii Y225]AJJ36254.1 putative membrane protein [Yersinia rochesterensis]
MLGVITSLLVFLVSFGVWIVAVHYFAKTIRWEADAGVVGIASVVSYILLVSPFLAMYHG